MSDEPTAMARKSMLAIVFLDLMDWVNGEHLMPYPVYWYDRERMKLSREKEALRAKSLKAMG